ncbi:hypothetical protein ACOX9X_10660 [Photobacterium leiognathi subsp. mandapamensis]|uniref:hypothetical protein n=1 Tax=Photobacterium leiognathi TaxID=553611 RepID=UPI003BF477A1
MNTSYLRMVSKKKLFNKALILSWGGVIINFGGFLIILPIATNSLNLIDFNFWLYSTTLLAVGIIIESSIVNPFNRLLIYAKDKKPIDNGKGNKYLNSINDSLLIMFRITMILSFIVFISTYIIGNVSTDKYNKLLDVNLYLILISLVCFFRVISTFAVSILHTEGLISIQKEIQFYLLLLKTILTIIVLYYYSSLLFVFIINAISVIIECFFYYYISLYKLQYYKKLKESKFSINVFNSIKKPVVNTFTIRVGGYFIAQSMAILSMQLSVEESTKLLFSIKCISLVYRISLMPFHVRLPDFVKYRANEEIDKIKRLYIKEMRLSILVYLLGILILIFLAKDIAKTIDVKVYFLDLHQLVFLSIIFFLELHHVTHSMIYETTNNVPFMKVSIFSGIAIFLFGFISNKLGYGVTELLLIQFIVQVSGNNWYPVYLSFKSTNWKLICYIKDMFGVNHGNTI